MRLLSTALAIVALGASMTAAYSRTACDLSDRFDDPHPVMHDGSKSLFWVRPLEVNADGARNAYHRDDPHGNKGLAIEYAGNGMTIYRGEEPMEFKDNEAENGDWLKIYREIVESDWKAPPGFKVDIYGFTHDEDGDICTRRGGRLVSSTSLVQYPRLALCNPKRYVDAVRLPGLVVPNRSKQEKSIPGKDPEVAPPFARRGVSRGDLAVVYNPETKLWKGTFIYDTGPRDLLGEGSLRLVMNLRNIRDVPKTAVETNSLGIVETFVVVFPRTARLLGPGHTWTQAKIEALATDRFKAWGGGSIETALEKLLVCAEKYKGQTSGN